MRGSSSWFGSRLSNFLIVGEISHVAAWNFGMNFFLCAYRLCRQVTFISFLQRSVHHVYTSLSCCNLGIQLGEYQLTDIDYADDIAIFAPSACVLQEALHSYRKKPTLWGCKSAGRRQNSWLSPPNPPTIWH